MRVNMINTVKGFITAKPSLADNDVDLIYAIWAWQMKKLKPSKKIESMSARELMKTWRSGKISSPFNISRSRRRCQEQFPETRGEVYAKRKAHTRIIKEDVKKATDLSD